MLFWNSVKTAALTAVCVGVVGTSVVVAQRSVRDSNPAPATPTGETTFSMSNGENGARVICHGPDGKIQWQADTTKAVSCMKPPMTDSPSVCELRVVDMEVWKKRSFLAAAASDAVVTIDVATGRILSGGDLVTVTVGGTPTGAVLPAVAGNPGKVFKPIDTAQSGMYGDGKWSYALEIKGDQRQGFLKYDAKNVGDPQPGDHILTPWGWMQWQEQGHWLPVAEKPAKGRQLPDPAR